MDGITSLKETIRTVPIPGAPPPLSRQGAAVGLAFLDMALRQNHVRRLTERLLLVEHLAATRTTEVDIRLSLLDKGQREASYLFQKLTSRSTGIEAEPASGRHSIWVPVTRISRRSVSPIHVFDASGSRLPRLTQYETSRLLAAGLYWLLRGILSSIPESRNDSDIGQFLFRVNESRWLVQTALVTLLTERSRPTTDTGSEPVSESVGSHGKQYRDIAIRILETFEDSLLDTYARLLDVAVNDYLLVVGLDAAKDDHLLSYDSPIHIDTQRSQPSFLRRWTRTDWSKYRAQYLARVPSSLRSYHVVVETEPGVNIETMSLVTNADEALATELAKDLKTLGRRLGQETRTPVIERKLLELELQSVLGRLSELLRKRRWEANQADTEMGKVGLRTCAQLAWACVSGRGVLNEDGEVRSSLLQQREVTPENLESAADEITNSELESDFWLDNDPASSRAHVYWRRTAPSTATSGHMGIRCAITLTDASGARPGSIVAYAIAVAITIYLISFFIEGTIWPYPRLGMNAPSGSVPNADAIVAVLLLVPGFLYTRLDLPARYTIIGRLRALSRHAAQSCIAAAVLVSAAVAAGVSGICLQLILLAGTAIPVLAAILLLWRPGHRRDATPYLGAPRWMAPSNRRELDRIPDATFFSSGADSA